MGAKVPICYDEKKVYLARYETSLLKNILALHGKAFLLKVIKVLLTSVPLLRNPYFTKTYMQGYFIIFRLRETQ